MVVFKLHLYRKLIFMTDENKKEVVNDNDNISKPDPETLHTTDPQKEMEGPVSSLMHDTGKAFNTDTTKKEADKERDNAL